jgi:hypothetical protein
MFITDVRSTLQCIATLQCIEPETKLLYIMVADWVHCALRCR